VLDRGSLTRRLQGASQGDFAVRVKAQGIQRPLLSERKALGIRGRELALVREVDLLCYGRTWVTARSVIPLSTLTGSERQLKHLGSKPLGAFLFASKTMRRGPLQVRRFDLEQGASFARRSVFRLHNKPLLVIEHFRSELLQREHGSRQRL